MRSLALCIAVTLCASCNGERQETETSLYRARVADSDLVPVEDSAFSNRFTTGPEGKPVLLQVRWTVGRDQSNCLRIDSLHVERKGGDPGVIVSDVKHGTVPCAMEWESEDTTRFETAAISLSYRARVGVKKHEFSGHVANITGTGDLTPVDGASQSGDASR